MPKHKTPLPKLTAPTKEYTPTPRDKRLAQAQLERRDRSRRAPKLELRHKPGKPIDIKPDHPDPKIGSLGLFEAFGTVETAFAIRQLMTLINATQVDHSKPVDQDVVNAGLAAINGINPDDEIEAMLATQMVATNYAAMDLLRRSAQADYTQTLNVYGNLAVKFLRTFTAQLDALQRYRGKGQQKIVVERVNVGEGGQAIVGTVERGGQGGGSREQSEEQSHAKRDVDASKPALRGEDEAGEAVPGAGGER
ncbi:MAG: hypothetical protein ACR2QJ_04855 [Geminicoccaceae bacterium]